MRHSMIVKLVLILAGAIAMAVGVGVLFVPHAFHASAGVVLGEDVNLLNEMRSSGGMVLVAGVVILAGALRAGMAGYSLLIAGVLYLSYGLSRGVSLALDGLPGGAMVQIMALELSVGGICLALLWARRTEA